MPFEGRSPFFRLPQPRLNGSVALAYMGEMFARTYYEQRIAYLEARVAELETRLATI